jgi:hypothetical protein
MLSVTFFHYYVGCHYVECFYAKCRYAECHCIECYCAMVPTMLEGKKQNSETLSNNDKKIIKFNGTADFKKCKQLFKYNIYIYIETSGGQSSNTYLNLVYFSTPVLNRNLWQLRTAVFLHWCLMHALPFSISHF